MTAERHARQIDRIIDTLERERDLLIAGDYGRLFEEAAARQALMEQLGGTQLAGMQALAPRLERLRAAAARNATLLRAALDGAAAGRRRLEEIMAARSSLSTYDASGAPVERTVIAGGSRRA
jgi:flagellar biosynthesis/type III secretory pathway chaperone